jgi:hypothetical protein
MKVVAVVLAFVVSTFLVRGDSTVVFNEIMYHPANTNEAQFEWVELHNQMAVDMEISGWYLTNGITYRFAEGTVVPGGGYIVVASSPADLIAATGATNVYGPFIGRLANGGDTIELRNNNNRVMDSVSYGVEGEWPVAPDGSGVALAKLNEDLGSALPQNWISSIRIGGTPGNGNFPSPRLVTTSQVLVPIEKTWKFDQSGATDWSSGSAWLQPDFPEIGWGFGPGLLAYETCGCLPEPIRTQLVTNTAVTTFYFRSGFNYTNDPHQATLSLRHVIDDGMILYLNGQELWRIGMPTGAVTFATASSRGVGEAVYEGPFVVPSTNLLQGTNILAAEVHQTAPGSSDITFGLTLSDLTTTFVGTQVQTGGVATVAFNELASSTNSAFWLELANYGSTNVPLGGYVIARLGGAYREYVLPAQTLAPGGLLQITKATLGFGVDSGDKLILYAPDRNNVLDAIVAKKSPRGRYPDGTGRWLYPDQPTPGATNHFLLHNEVVINEIMYDHRAVPATPPLYETNLLVPITNIWTYNQQGVDLGTNWIGADYDDSLWPSGRALFYNATAVLPAPKNTQISLTNSSGTRLITWYFRTEFVFTGSFSGLELNLRPIVDDGAVFYLNGTEVNRLNMAPSGEIRYTNFASASVATPTYTGPFAIPTNFLVLGTNILAVELHQFTTNGIIQSLDAVFGTELFGTRLVSPALPYHDSPESWIELFNRSSNAVNLTDWKIDGGIDYAFASNRMIAPGAYLILAKDPAYLQALYPGLDILGPFDHKLSHQSDYVALFDPLGNPASEVRYFAAGRWPEYAHAGGSSLELRDPRADTMKAESWAASDEASKSQWSSYVYRGVATAETANSPTLWREFVLGLLTAGEILLDDISVVDVPSGKQLIQNGSFESGINTWRIIGDHKGVVEIDPTTPGNHVLHLTATGPTEHMHNHAETTLVGGTNIINGREYQISFRAKWLAGSSDLHTRLYFNRLPVVTQLPVPALAGTPGARNSRYTTNSGPTYSDFGHLPVVPNANQSVIVSVAASDPDGVSAMSLWWSVNGGSWNQAAMTLSNGLYRGTIPGNGASSLVQFYVQGTDLPGASSTFPARGPNSRALFRVNDNAAIFDRLHNMRLLMTTPDVNLLHASTNVMSNDNLGATLIYDEREVFYDIALHLQSSERGRNDSSRVGFTIEFHPDQLFRGVHDLISIDRSGGYSGRGGDHDEILLKHMISHAGGVYGMYDDLVHVIAPRSQENSTGLMLMAKYGDVFLDSQFENGADGNHFKLELIYYPLNTVDGNVQSAKLPQPDNVLNTDLQDLGNNKESYRWNFLNENNHVRDDYSGIMTMAKTFSLNGAALDAQSRQVLDVNEWLRAMAVESLAGVGDTYSYGLEHNIMFYIRPTDLKTVVLLWDMDFAWVGSTTAGLWGGNSVAKLISLPSNQRTYYGHLYDLINTTFNSTYVSRWASHYGSLVSQNWSGIPTYIGQRTSYVLSQLPTQTPFAILSNNGNNFSTNNNLVVLSGSAPIQVHAIQVNGISYAITWNNLTNWTVRVPIASGPNTLTVRGIDAHGNTITTAFDTITVTDTSPVPQPKDFVVINEIMYHSAVDEAGFVEIHNIHTNVSFDLSNWRLDGASFTFPQGSVILPGGFLLAVNDANVFAQTYGFSIPIAGEYSGTLQNGGETLKLVRPGVNTNLDEIIDEVRYDDSLPWPAAADGFGPSLQLIDPTQENYRAANWVASGYTPGATNSVRAALPLFPPVWINEVLPVNTNSIADNFGQREPWIELFNNGTNTVSLNGFFLTDNYSNLTQWPFPAGASIGPRQFVVIWADGEPGQTTANDWHTNFRFTNSAGSIALVRTNTGRAEVLDYFNYFGLSANHSFGSVPDGQPQRRQFFFYLTPGASNNPAAPPVPVVINEWMAANAGPTGFPDPADNLFQDWFELYNPNTNSIDLSGYYLTDNLTVPTLWAIPPGTFIGGRSFLLVWADKNTAQNGTGTNGDLHADFQLNNDGEQIGLFAPDGTPQSAVTFGNQSQNVSQGLYPDGNTNAVYFMTNFTPRAANQIQPPAAPHVETISVSAQGLVSIMFTITPGARYRIEFKDNLNAPTWTSLGEEQTAAASLTTAYDNVGPGQQRFYHVVLSY